MIAVLFARADSVYKTIAQADVYDAARDATTFPGGCPVVCHPPCRAWGTLRHMARPRPGEADLALFAIRAVRSNGGVLEHPRRSTLWQTCQIPTPPLRDQYGGWLMPIFQHDFGHRAQKSTMLYIVGLEPRDLPDYPITLGEAARTCGGTGRRRDGQRLTRDDPRWRPEISHPEREHTPPALARWLVAVATRCRPPPQPDNRID